MSYKVQKFANFDNLQELRTFLQKCIGPKGSYKFITTSGSQVRYCKSSHGLVSSILSEVQDPCVETILHLVKSHISHQLDFGLSLGSLTCDLILNGLEIDFTEIILPILEATKFPVPLDDLPMMLSFLTSTLPMPGFDSEQFVTKLLEAFLCYLPENMSQLDHFYIDLIVQNGTKNNIEIKSGFLYAVPDIDHPRDLRWTKYGQKDLNIILTDFQLKHNM